MMPSFPVNQKLASADASEPFDERLELLVEEAARELQAGNLKDLTRFIAAHPEYSNELRELLPAVELLVHLGNQAEGASTGAVAKSVIAPLPCEQLGDFKLIREIGRGGMGVVYEAEQISLGRRVALKVLPFAAILDNQHLARFHNEARAAATLDHPHIVSVYSVGCDHGVHFFAMQLIDGQSMAEMIADLRQDAVMTPHQPARAHSSLDDPRAAALSTTTGTQSPRYFYLAAELGIQAALAIDHAHARGILHRDVKPANLMLDGSGKLWVTDFGLARLGEDVGLTKTGELLGTLRYMSPEQVVGKRGIVDQTSDIYSLGATLYELLALAPAYDGADRPELLRQIVFDEPRRLRKINRRIPLDLETIVAKAMNKDAVARYPTAAELADDLRRFIAGQPIHAQPPTYADRLWKWSRRRRGLVRAAALALVLITATLAVSAVMIKRAQREALAALEETSELLYLSDMALACQAWEKGWSDEVQSILNRHGASAAKPDRRGFEWRLLQKMVQPPDSVTLAGHNGPVNEIAVFPDRTKLATVGDDGTLRIWDLPARKLLKTIKLSNEGLHSVAVSPDGLLVAAGSTVLYLCDLAEANRVSEVLRRDYTFESLAFSPDGARIAAGSRYEEVCLTSIDGKVVTRIPCASRVESLEFVPQSAALLVPARRSRLTQQPLGIIDVWRDDLSAVERELDGSWDDRLSQITIARPSPSGEFVAAGEAYQSRAYLFHLSSGKIVAETPVSRDRLTDLAYSPDGKAIAIGYRNGRVEYFNLRREDRGNVAILGHPRVIEAHQGETHSVRFVTADVLATCGTDGMVRIWNRPINQELALNLSESELTGMELSPDGSSIIYTCGSEFAIAESESGDVRFRRSDADAGYFAPTWSPLGDRVAVCRKQAPFVVVHDRRGQFIYSIRAKPSPQAATFSPDGRLIAIVGDQQLQIYDANGGKEIFRHGLDNQGFTAGFSRDGERLAYGGRFGEIIVSSARQHRRLCTFACESDANCLAFSLDDRALVTGHADGVIRVWDLETRRLRAELVGHERSVQSVAFSPDGRTLLSAAKDGAIRLWSVERNRGYGVVYRRFGFGPTNDDFALSLSADGSRMAVRDGSQLEGGPDVLMWKIEGTEFSY